MNKFNLSHIIEATYFLKDTKIGLVAEYKTNSHGKRFVSMTLKSSLGGEIPFVSYDDVKRAVTLLERALKNTRGHWYYKKEKKEG